MEGTVKKCLLSLGFPFILYVPVSLLAELESAAARADPVTGLPGEPLPELGLDPVTCF